MRRFLIPFLCRLGFHLDAGIYDFWVSYYSLRCPHCGHTWDEDAEGNLIL